MQESIQERNLPEETLNNREEWKKKCKKEASTVVETQEKRKNNGLSRIHLRFTHCEVRKGQISGLPHLRNGYCTR